MKMHNEEDWDLFLELCLKTKTPLRLQELFNLFLTLEEKEHLASRMQIIRALLDKKLAQREISDKMQVSISQITRGSNALKIVDKDFLKFIQNSINNYKKNEQ